jgi:perosamine synthetase
MIASANAVRLAGGKPILVDVDSENLCLDLNLARQAVTDRTRAIIYVSLNGRCHNMDLVSTLAEETNVILLEDAAQSLGCRYKGKHLGTFGKCGAFSFSTPKIITTGQGGAVVTDDEELRRRMLLIKDFGRPKSGVDYHLTLGYNFKFTDLQAVIGIEQIKKLDWRLNRKKEMYKIYFDLLERTPGIRFVDTDLKDTAPWFIDIIVEGKRDQLAASLQKSGIGTRPFYPAIHTQPPYGNSGSQFPNSEHLATNGLWLPSSTRLEDEDIKWTCSEIDAYMRGCS